LSGFIFLCDGLDPGLHAKIRTLPAGLRLVERILEKIIGADPFFPGEQNGALFFLTWGFGRVSHARKPEPDK